MCYLNVLPVNVFIHNVLLRLQTYLEQTKMKFNKDYRAMNPAKITTTVGLNSMNPALAFSKL